MLKTISEASANFLKNKDIITDAKWNIYVYGFKVIYSTSVCFISIFILGMLQNKLLQTLVFIFYFILIRSFAGGYHAPTFIGCFFVTNGAYILERFLAEIIVCYICVQWIIFIVSILYIWWKAPVKNFHRILNKDKICKNRIRARICLLGTFLSVFIYQMLDFREIMPEIVSTMAIVAGMIFITKERSV